MGLGWGRRGFWGVVGVVGEGPRGGRGGGCNRRGCIYGELGRGSVRILEWGGGVWEDGVMAGGFMDDEWSDTKWSRGGGFWVGTQA